MKIAITGGAGFIGSHLAAAYLERGDEVAIIDNLSTGYIQNIQFLMDNPAYKNRLNVKIDTILNPRVIAELIGPADLVFHLAAAVGVRYIIENPLESIKTNIQGTEIVLDLCSRFDKKILTLLNLLLPSSGLFFLRLLTDYYSFPPQFWALASKASLLTRILHN